MALPDIVYEESAKLVFEYWEREAAAVRIARGQPGEVLLWGDLDEQWKKKWRDVIANVVDMTARVMLADMHAAMSTQEDDLTSIRTRAILRYSLDQFQYDPRG